MLWDKQTGRIVSNDFQTIDVDLASEFDPPAGGGVELYPAELRSEIDEVSRFVYENVNDGVYPAGFAQTQPAYEAAFDSLFAALAALAALEERLSAARYLVGNRLTLADVRRRHLCDH